MKPFLSKELELRTGNVLFMDIVGYSKLKADKQAEFIKTLNQIVLESPAVASQPKKNCLMIPTGDGMAIAFLDNPEAPLLAARQIDQQVKGTGIPLRMGMHTGPVYLIEDINSQLNLVGSGINLAQRVMDCGDEGHILASEVVAHSLSEVKEEYERLFYYLGSFEVKHKVIIDIYNVYGKGFGNPSLPKRSPKSGETLDLTLSLHGQISPEPNFVGRVEMLKSITEWYKNPNTHIGALIGWGGVGKSALVRKWYDSLEENGIHPDGIFWWDFYRNPYFEPFLNALLKYISQGQIDPETIKSTWEKTEKIKEYIHKRIYLIILDGLEKMQKSESGDEFGKMIHHEFTEILHYLADAHISGLCLITTRYPLKDLDRWHERSYKTLSLIDLSISDALSMLRTRCCKGNDEDMEEVIRRYKGHALSLTSVAGYLKKYYDGDIKKAPEIEFVFNDKERFKDVTKLLRRYAEKMSEAELVFLNIFALFRKEVTEREFTGVFRHEIKGTKFNDALVKMNELDFKDLVSSLVDWRLITYELMTKRKRHIQPTH